MKVEGVVFAPGQQIEENAMAFEFVDVKRSGRITIVTLNRPGVMNALHKPAHFELHEVFEDHVSVEDAQAPTQNAPSSRP